jgi:hypothetical protein
MPYKVAFDKLKPSDPTPSLLKSDNTFTQTPKESIELLLNKLLPGDDIKNDDNYHKNIRQKAKETYDSENDIDFTYAEVSKIINNLKSNKTSGWDQINDQIIKTIFDAKLALILKIYNTCIALGQAHNSFGVYLFLPSPQRGGSCRGHSLFQSILIL